MAEKDASTDRSPGERDVEESGKMSNWQMAWLKRHEDELVERMPTMEVLDHLITSKRMHPGMDIYQTISSPMTIPNVRARFLLGFIRSQSSFGLFWDFQEVLAKTTCADIAVTRQNADAVKASFSSEELKAAFYTAWEQGRPASVVKVHKKQKERYRALTMPSFDGRAGRMRKPVSLDEIHVNISLLSSDRLDALSGGSPGQTQPFEMRSLKKKMASIIKLEDIFEKDEDGQEAKMQVAAGIAGSGKSTAFTLKAAFEWSKEDRDRAFWETFGLFFTRSLNDPSWWKAEDLAQVFGLSRYGLSPAEKEEVVGYICDHSEEVLMVADSLDEADVAPYMNSLLWQVLCGNCQDLPRLRVIICSRPCEKTLWLSRQGLIDRQLEVVGFTDEKITQFISAFFRQDPQKARQLHEQLASQPDVLSLMHTPLLATLICRLFAWNKALPRTQTGVYEAAVLAMLKQSTKREMKGTPTSILEELSSPALQAAFVNLCKLAYDGLASKKVIFSKSELQAAGCLGEVVELGFLSSTSGVDEADCGEDAYAFQHHTMVEFFAAVHAVRVCIRQEKKGFASLVQKLGTDGNYARFWPFVSGLLSAVECEPLLSALAQPLKTHKQRALFPTRSFLLLLHCHAECVAKLPCEGSPSISGLLSSEGLTLTSTHLSESDAHAATVALRQYRAVIRTVNLYDSTLDNGFELLAELQKCEQLSLINLEAYKHIAGTAPTIDTIIDCNKRTLERLSIPVNDDDFADFAPSIKKCKHLVLLQVGSRHLTNASASIIVELLRHHHRLRVFGLYGQLDDVGFTLMSPPLRAMAGHLKKLILHWTKVSPALLREALSFHTDLQWLTLVRNPLGDGGFQQLATTLRQTPTLTTLILHDVGLTWQSLAEIEKLLHALPSLTNCQIDFQKNALCSSEQVIEEIPRLLSPNMTLVAGSAFKDSNPHFKFGVKMCVGLQFKSDRSQVLSLYLFQ